MSQVNRKTTGRLGAGLLGIFFLAAEAYAAPASEELNAIHRYTYPSGNLIRNGSFEANRSVVEWEGWSEGMTRNPSVFSLIESDSNLIAAEGHRLMAVNYVRPVGGDSALKLMSDFFPLKAGKQYTLSFLYQSRRVGSARFMPVVHQWKARSHIYNADSGTYTLLTGPGGASFQVQSDVGKPYLITPTWQSYTLSFTAHEEATVGNLFLVYGADTGTRTTLYFDDVRLIEGRHPAADAGVTRKFTNGNNKVIQSITQDGGFDIVSSTFYDRQGRVWRSALPIGNHFGVNQHRFVPGITAQMDESDYLKYYYNPSSYPDTRLFEDVKYPDAGGRPFAETRYEPSTLGREVEVSQPGAAWQPGTHTTRTAYASAVEVDDYATLPAPAGNSGEFFLKQITDPDGRVMREFTDRMGRVVRSAVLNGEDWINTDFTHDAAGNVIRIEAPYSNGGRLTTDMTYNYLKEMTSETTPSTGTTRFMNDALGRPRFSQTEQQRAQNRFSYVKYDPMGRVEHSGDILDTGWFSQDRADYVAFPCYGCEDGEANIGSDLRLRVVNLYDDTTGQELMTCGDNFSPVTLPTYDNNPNNVNFLGVDTEGEPVAAAQDFWTAYQTTLDEVTGQEGDVTIYVIRNQGQWAAVDLPPASEIPLSPEGQAWTFESVERGTFAGEAAQELYDELIEEQSLTLAGYNAYLRGRLSKTLACNWELADSLGESAPREVSKLFRYDKNGNAVRVIEVNGYQEDPYAVIQGTKSKYDVQNRLSTRIVCGNLACHEGVSHVENYHYDQAGRVKMITDKYDQLVLWNEYDRIGRIARQVLGGPDEGYPNPLEKHVRYHLQGWQDSVKYVRQDTDTRIFSEKLHYETGASTPVYGGDIGRADVVIATGLSTASALSHEYAYDPLGRLSSAASPQDGEADEEITYLNDGRINTFSRGTSNSGSYTYDGYGRLEEVTGDLVDGRNMEGAPFLYDLNGNLVTDTSKTQDGQPLVIRYRSDNLPFLFRYKNGNDELVEAYMVYDEAGNRVSKIVKTEGDWTSTKSYFTSGKEVRERDGGSTMAYYNFAGMGRVSYSDYEPAGHRELYVTDHLGSTRLVYDLDSAKVTYATHYYPYGKTFGEDRTAEEDVTQKFTTKELDDGIDLTYFGARYYDQELGVWTGPDSKRQFRSVYSYDPDPINMVDPDGRATITAGVNLAAIVGGGGEGSAGIYVSGGPGTPFDIGYYGSIGWANGITHRGLAAELNFSLGYSRGGANNLRGYSENLSFGAGKGGVTMSKTPSGDPDLSASGGKGKAGFAFGAHTSENVTGTFGFSDVVKAVSSYFTKFEQSFNSVIKDHDE